MTFCMLLKKNYRCDYNCNAMQHGQRAGVQLKHVFLTVL